MKDWWTQLNSRERQYLSIGGVFLFCVIAYFFVWSPFTSALNNARNSVDYNQQLLSWMQHAQTQIKQLRQGHHNQQRISNDDLLSITAETLSDNQLSQFTPQVLQSSQNKVKVIFDRVPFDQVVRWLQQTSQKYAIRIDTLNVAKKGKLGMVQASIELATS